MALEKITKTAAKGVHVPGDDIDTDRIIPARFMKCVTFDGLGAFAFYDERFDETGGPKEHPLNSDEHRGAGVLLSGRNFGCGSSREHAPQSLHKAGIRALVAESFAEIFFGNCTTLGMPCVTMPKERITEIAGIIEADPDGELVVDLEAKTLSAGGKSFGFEMPESARGALVAGKWDQIQELIEGAPEVKRTYDALPYTGWGG